MYLLSILLITAASIEGALSAHGDHHPTGSEIRRLRKHSGRSAAGKFLKGVEQKASHHVFIGIPSASQVTPIPPSAWAPPPRDSSRNANDHSARSVWTVY